MISKSIVAFIFAVISTNALADTYVHDGSRSGWRVDRNPRYVITDVYIDRRR